MTVTTKPGENGDGSMFLAHTPTPEEQFLQDRIDQILAKLNQRLQEIEEDRDILELEEAAAKLYFGIHKRRINFHK